MQTILTAWSTLLSNKILLINTASDGISNIYDISNE